MVIFYAVHVCSFLRTKCICIAHITTHTTSFINILYKYILLVSVIFELQSLQYACILVAVLLCDSDVSTVSYDSYRVIAFMRYIKLKELLQCCFLGEAAWENI